MIVRISSSAEKQFRNLSKVDQIILAKKIRSLSDIKQVISEEKLKGYKGIYRVRIGNFRIVYRRGLEEIFIILIGHRKEVYDNLRRLVG